MAQFAYGSDDPRFGLDPEAAAHEAEINQQQDLKQQQEQQLAEALMRFQSGTTYSDVIANAQDMPEGTRPVGEMAPWERQLVAGLAPKGDYGLPSQPYGFDERALHPGDRDLVLKELIRQQRLRKRHRR